MKEPRSKRYVPYKIKEINSRIKSNIQEFNDNPKPVKLPQFSKRVYLNYYKISRDDERRHELKLAKRKTSDPLTFVQLFKERIKDLKTEKVYIYVTYTIMIKDPHEDKEKPEKRHLSEIVEMPVNLSIKDKYKFILSLIPYDPNGYSYTVSIDSATIKIVRNIKTRDIPMRGLKLRNILLESYNGFRDINGDGLCVTEYVWAVVRNQPGFKKYTKDKLKNEINMFAYDDNITTKSLIMWRNRFHRYISIYALDPLYNCFEFSPALTNSSKPIKLCYLVHDNHCFPIFNENIISRILKKANDPLYLDTIEFSSEGDNIYYGDLNDNILKDGKENSVIVLPNDKSIKEALNDTVGLTGSYIPFFKYNVRNSLSSFTHPKMNCLITENDDYDTRKLIADTLYNRWPVYQFMFRNQSLSKLSSSLFELYIGYLPKSVYNKGTFEALCKWAPNALIESFAKTKFNDEGTCSYDICKCYSSVLEMNYDIPLYTIHDKIVPYDNSEIVCGEYFLHNVEIKRLETENGEPFMLPSGFYSYVLVKILLNANIISKHNIGYMIRANSSIKGTKLAPFVELCYSTFDEKIAKSLVNRFIGLMGSKYTKSYKGFMSTDFDSVVAAWLQNEKHKCSVEELEIKCNEKIYIFKKHIEEPKLENMTSIWRHVISLGILKLINVIYGVNGTLVAVSTDCVIVKNNTIEYPLRTIKTKCIRGHTYKDNIFRVPHSNGYMSEEYREITVPKGSGCIWTGVPGCGKTTKLVQMYKENDVVLCFTNKACDNLRNLNVSAFTFDSFFSSVGKLGSVDKLKNRRVLVDEFSMVPNKWMTILYLAYVKHGIEIHLFGDPFQCDPVDNQIFNYLESPGVLEMCPNVIEMKYHENSRYDKRTHDILMNFQKTGFLDFEKREMGTWVNICYFNNTRDQINKKYCKLFSRNHRNRIIGDIPISVGMPVICECNMKKEGIYNGQIFNIQSIEPIKINGLIFSDQDFTKKFKPAFCVTVYKMQGSTIREPYTIHDAYSMDKKQMYTALSRCTTIEDVYVTGTKSIYKTQNKKHLVMEPFKTEFHNGKIYCISFENGKNVQFYIGSTTRELQERLKEHYNNLKSPICGKKSSIHLICYAPCKNKTDLEIIENKFINKYSNCVNSKGKIKEWEPVTFKSHVVNNDEYVEKMRNKFKITELNDRFRIKYTDATGKQKIVERRFCKKPRNEVYDVMVEIQNKLIQEYG